MITAGVDIGSTTAKALILQDHAVVARAVIPACLDPAESARQVLALCLQTAGLPSSAIQSLVGTGYGQQQIAFATRLESEITCHARGAFFHHPAARTLIDIGGQDSKVIKMDARGKVVQYSYNDKCASGTGRFLEIMAEALGVGLDEMGAAGRTCVEKLTISNQCVIFAETEVVSLINEEKAVGDILNALFRAMAHRVASQARTLAVEADVLLSGGVAKNIGVFEALAHSLGVTLQTPSPMDPQLNGALGAALLAQEG
jgi:predicted CoA-substrate-specific enzyme activase